MPIPEFQFTPEIIGGPYDGVINNAMSGLLLDCKVPTSDEAMKKIADVKLIGIRVMQGCLNADKSIDMKLANPILDYGQLKLEDCQAAVSKAREHTFTPDETYREGFDHVARYLAEVFESQGMGAIELPARRILEATDSAFVAASALELRFNLKSWILDAQFMQE